MFSISVPLPTLDDKSAKELKKLLKGLEKASQAGPVRGGVAAEGDAAAYALVWEWGNARQTQKGPKTTLGTNPDGEQVWLSIQAPFGYIRINEPEYIAILERALAEADFSDIADGEAVRAEMWLASKKAGEMIASIIKDTVPVDTGLLRESINGVDPDDPDLAIEDDDLELGSEDFSYDG